MKETFTEETRQLIYNAQNGYCKGTVQPIHDFHHKLHNTKPNRKNFPLFVQSPMNCVGLCREEHEQHPHKYNITEQEAKVYELYLESIVKDGYNKNYWEGVED